MQLALLHSGKTKSEIQAELKIGNTILISSDFDGAVFAGYALEGLLNVPATLTLYASAKDEALGYSNWLFSRTRLGQIEASLSNDAKEFLFHFDNLYPIDVSQAPGTDLGDGHQYFRQSPWVSSDILSTLLYDLRPSERGLVSNNGSPIWEFPENYVEKLRSATLKSISESP